MLRDSLTREVTNDAYYISSQIFKGVEPDVSRVSSEQLDERYRQAFMSGDRQYLQQEATRDPTQFLAAMERLGVSMPPGSEITPDAPLPKSAKPNVPIPKPPEAAQPQFVEEPTVAPSPPLPAAPPPAGGSQVSLQPPQPVAPPALTAPVTAPPLPPPLQGP